MSAGAGSCVCLGPLRMWGKRRVWVREPKLGLRHNLRPVMVLHRFPVKGGVSFREWLSREANRATPLFRLLVKNSIGLRTSGNTCGSGDDGSGRG